MMPEFARGWERDGDDLVKTWKVGPLFYMATVMDAPDPKVLVLACTIPAGSSICVPVSSTGEGMQKAEQLMSGLAKERAEALMEGL